MTLKQDIVDIVKESVEIKIDLAKIANGLVDKCLEPALQKVVDDTTNPFDNAAMAMVYPTLEKELKELVAKEVKKLEEFIATKLAEIKA